MKEFRFEGKEWAFRRWSDRSWKTLMDGVVSSRAFLQRIAVRTLNFPEKVRR